ncbi:hypothetical protein WJX74_006821 [Apatococcus lobatus]|uniref:EF-hand domain-containing protein n=1 Tax=Apatococcus lobatus TaxID=904363 RepID=A0AAW1R0V7_9CHLO
MGNANGRPAAGLSKTEMERMHRRFRRLAGGEDRLSLATLHEQPDLAGNAFVHRIFRLFDTDQDGFLTWEDFSAGIHQICGLSTEDDQSLFAFRLYDTDQSGRVSEKELADALKLSGSQLATEAQLQQIVSNTIGEHDRDRDGELSLLEFRAMLRTSQQDAENGVDF